MKILAYPLMMIAGLGFLLSLSAHVLALFGISPSGGGLVWGLHVGIFVVWLPVVYINKQKGTDHWKAVKSGCPGWMRWGVTTVFAYAIVNFILFIAGMVGH